MLVGKGKLAGYGVPYLGYDTDTKVFQSTPTFTPPNLQRWPRSLIHPLHPLCLIQYSQSLAICCNSLALDELSL